MADYIQKRNAATEYSLIYNMNYYPFEGRNTNSIVASNTITISKNNNKVMRSFDDIEYSMNLPGERNIYSFYSIDDNYICENMIDKNNASTIGCFRQKYASPAEFNPNIIQIGGTLDISNVDATKDKIEYLGTENIINRNCDKFIITTNELYRYIQNTFYTVTMDQYTYSKFLNTSAKISICLDSETGLILNATIYKLVDNNYTQILLEQQMTKISFQVPDSSFMIPRNFSVVDSTCNETEIILLTDLFKGYDGKASIKIYNSGVQRSPKNLRKEIDINQKFESNIQRITATYNLPFPTKEENYQYELCIDNECEQDSCSPDICHLYSLNETACNSQADCVYSATFCEWKQ
jgi:hypothetical protein